MPNTNNKELTDKELSRELTDEELSNVIGGQSRASFSIWRAKLINELGSRSYEERQHPAGKCRYGWG